MLTKSVAVKFPDGHATIIQFIEEERYEKFVASMKDNKHGVQIREVASYTEMRERKGILKRWLGPENFRRIKSILIMGRNNKKNVS